MTDNPLLHFWHEHGSWSGHWWRHRDMADHLPPRPSAGEIDHGTFVLGT